MFRPYIRTETGQVQTEFSYGKIAADRLVAQCREPFLPVCPGS